MPATPPFPNYILEKMRSTNQAVRWFIEFGPVREFRAYCCTIDAFYIMGVSKEPVPIIDLSPNPICLGGTISWDISDSYAPGSTLTSWSIDFGDSSSDSGADFPNDTTSGTHIYATANTYSVVVTVAEGGGKSQTSTIQVEVLECGTPLAGPGSEFGTTAWQYVATDGSGVFFIDWSADSPQWEARNIGLEGNALSVRNLEIRPGSKRLPNQFHELWAATLDGVYTTTDGGRSWGKIPLPNPPNSPGDNPTANEMDYHKIIFDPSNGNNIYIVASGEGEA